MGGPQGSQHWPSSRIAFPSPASLGSPGRGAGNLCSYQGDSDVSPPESWGPTVSLEAPGRIHTCETWKTPLIGAQEAPASTCCIDLASPCPYLGLSFLTCSAGVVQLVLFHDSWFQVLRSWTSAKALGWKELAVVVTLRPLVAALGTAALSSLGELPSWGGREAGVEAGLLVSVD